MDIQENIDLARYTTLGVGGPARFFCDARTEEDVVAAVNAAASLSVPILVLGGGSNLVIADRGFAGLVIRTRLLGIDISERDAGVVVTVGAGEEWDRVVERCVAEGFAGVECLSGIPGSVGGTPVQNVGAYGQDVSETIVSVRCYDRINGVFADLGNAECGFEYRSSIFNGDAAGRYVVLSVRFRLTPGGRPRVTYKDLVRVVDPGSASLREVRSAVLKIRRQKSMVIDPNDPNSRSVGSFFKNPIIDTAVAVSLAEILDGNRPVTYPAGDGKAKVSAAWLIEQCGFPKGYALGNAGISANHSLAIINRGGASAAEIVALKEEIEQTVAEKTGIELTPEPVLIGFEA